MRITNPTISAVIPWCNRTEISRTLRENLPLIHRSGGELILVNCGGDPHQLEELLRESDTAGLRIAQLECDFFSKTLALNAGIELSRAPLFFALDCDVILREDTLPALMAEIEGKAAFATVRWMLESERQEVNPMRLAVAQFQNEFLCSLATTVSMDLGFSDGSRIALPISREDVFTGARFGCALLLVKTADLRRAGGFNSELRLWGWEDLDIQIRLKKVLQLEHVEAGESLHLSHGDDKRSLNNQPKQQRHVESLRQIFAHYSKDEFLGTLEADWEEWKDKVSEWEFDAHAGLQAARPVSRLAHAH